MQNTQMQYLVISFISNVHLKYLKNESVVSFENLLCKRLLSKKEGKDQESNNQAPHLTHDTNGKETTSQLDITNESQEFSPFPAGDHKASTNRHA